MPETEMLYHVRQDDSVVGSIERNRAHAEGLLRRSGIVFLRRSDGKVLLQRRSPLKRIFPNRFDSSCSFHVIFRESYEEAAVRELKEETGISASVRFLGEFVHEDKPENQIVAVFMCESDASVMIDREETLSAVFYSKGEVDGIVAREKVTPWLRDGWKLASRVIPHLPGS